MAREVVYSSQNNHQGASSSSSSPLMVVIDHWNFSFQKWRFLEDKVSSPLFQDLLVSKEYFPVQQVSIINFTCMIRVKYCLDRKSLETKEINKSL